PLAALYHHGGEHVRGSDYGGVASGYGAGGVRAGGYRRAGLVPRLDWRRKPAPHAVSDGGAVSRAGFGGGLAGHFGKISRAGTGFFFGGAVAFFDCHDRRPAVAGLRP